MTILNDMILLSAGHHPKAPGVCFPPDNRSWCEHEEVLNWLSYIILLTRQRIRVGVVPTGPLRGKVEWINDQCKKNRVRFAMELHFNSDTSDKAKGSETLYCPGSVKGEFIATVIQGYLGSVMKPNRGAVEGWYQRDPKKGIDYFLEKTHCPAIIVEPEFIYNRQAIEGGRTKACEEIVNGLVEAYDHA